MKTLGLRPHNQARKHTATALTTGTRSNIQKQQLALAEKICHTLTRYARVNAKREMVTSKKPVHQAAVGLQKSTSASLLASGSLGNEHDMRTKR
jgi:hypothetical protein